MTKYTSLVSWISEALLLESGLPPFKESLSYFNEERNDNFFSLCYLLSVYDENSIVLSEEDVNAFLEKASSTLKQFSLINSYKEVIELTIKELPLDNLSKEKLTLLLSFI